jgi:hypothetical protein
MNRMLPVRVRAHLEPSSKQDSGHARAAPHRRVLLVHVLADEQDRLRLATSRELTSIIRAIAA